jgi:hypothetical protein
MLWKNILRYAACTLCVSHRSRNLLPTSFSGTWYCLAVLLSDSSLASTRVNVTFHVAAPCRRNFCYLPASAAAASWLFLPPGCFRLLLLSANGYWNHCCFQLLLPSVRSCCHPSAYAADVFLAHRRVLSLAPIAEIRSCCHRILQRPPLLLSEPLAISASDEAASCCQLLLLQPVLSYTEAIS